MHLTRYSDDAVRAPVHLGLEGRRRATIDADRSMSPNPTSLSRSTARIRSGRDGTNWERQETGRGGGKPGGCTLSLQFAGVLHPQFDFCPNRFPGHRHRSPTPGCLRG